MDWWQPDRSWRAGEWTLRLRGDELADIAFAGRPVLRSIRAVARDHDWNTADLVVDGIGEDAGALTLQVRASGAVTGLSGTVRVAASGRTLTVELDLAVAADLDTNRTGLVVLHPAHLAGARLRVRHADGSHEDTRFPAAISPHQPVFDITALSWHAAGLGVGATFTGDVFEMEDQRNWTDGSYKTYVRPLALPWPYRVAKGEPFRQSVTVTVEAAADAAPAAGASGAVTMQLLPTNRRFPEIGVGLRPECLAQELSALDILKTIGARHLIAHFDPDAGHGLSALQGYAQVAERSGLRVTLELAVPCKRPLDEEMAGFAALVRAAGLDLDTLFVCPSVDRQSTPPGSAWPDCPPLEDVYAAARAAFPGVRLGGGMMSYFTELNRKRVPGGLVDYVSHCTNPIVHAADDLSVMQTFEALRFVVSSARAIYGEKPYRIGPSTIAMRQNPYGSATKDNPSGARIPMANVDPRHNGQFGAAWTLAYAATVASAGLEVLTLSTLAGPFGLVAGEGEATAEGNMRPLGHVLARLGALAGEPVLSVETSRPDAVVGLASPERLLLANITPEPQAVALPAGKEITLPPYGWVEIVL